MQPFNLPQRDLAIVSMNSKVESLAHVWFVPNIATFSHATISLLVLVHCHNYSVSHFLSILYLICHTLIFLLNFAGSVASILFVLLFVAVIV